MTLSSRAVPDGLVEDLRAENQRLRAALAQSDQPCAYCSLPKDEWAKCASGFPGCDRADDAMGCPELGASIRATTAERERDEAMAALREKEERVKAAIKLVDGYGIVLTMIAAGCSDPQRFAKRMLAEHDAEAKQLGIVK